MKQRVVRSYANRFGLRILVESGTYLGDMVAAVRDVFSEIYSIELSPDLAQRARARFSEDEAVRIIHGDSGSVLPSLLPSLSEPCLFWLDGHYSGGITALGDSVTPIVGELHAILARGRPADVILIDDARLFQGRDGYPELDVLRRLVAHSRPQSQFEVRHDIVRIHPAINT